jgi:uracil phosphoribosyltransferase
MTLHLLSENNSILHHFMRQLRDVHIQNDRMRFRRNVERIGEIMAYEISKSLNYKPIEVTTPLGIKNSHELETPIVVCSILRAGLTLHQGFLGVFDDAENGFVSAFRHHPHNDDAFEIRVDYQAAPDLKDKTLILVDPMLATGQSIEAVFNKLQQEFQPKSIHIAVVIAAPEGVEYLKKNIHVPFDLWVADLDDCLNDKKYIVPGLGDAGDLAYGTKL